MVRIRMQRFGRRHRPFYRINAIDKRTRRDGKVIENLGWYDPVAKDPEKQLFLKEDRIKHWLSVGAQPSETVRDFLARAELIDVQAWEADRKRDRDRVTCKTAVSKTEDALTAITELNEASEADLSSFVATATSAASEAKTAVAKADADGAAAAAKSASDALAGAKDADAKAKAVAEAKAKAEEEAKAKAEAEAAAAEGESGGEESSESE